MGGRTLIKICGLTRVSDVEVAVAEGVDMLGFVFDRGPCAIGAAVARELLSVARAAPYPVTCVAVVGTLSEARTAELVRLGFDAVQMEAGAYRPGQDGRPWSLPAFFDDGNLEQRVDAFRARHRPRFDRRIAGEREDEGATSRPIASVTHTPCGLVNVDGRGGGGTGTRADWAAAAALARRGPLMLAGGLTPDNVARALAEVAPAAVDVSSGVEASPACKDPARLSAFVATVRQFAHD